LGVREHRVGRLITIGALSLAGLTSSGCGGRPPFTIVTTNDVAGKTSPCGCHTPKGGLARRAALMDSLRRVKPENVFAVDAGGFFPVTDDERDAGPFMLRAMGRMRVRAAGVAPGDLRFGYSFLNDAADSARVWLVCANLRHRGNDEPAFRASGLLSGNGVSIGVFGLMPEGADLGPARDSLVATSPEKAARSAIATLRAQGAQFIVLLSQLGQAQGESLAVHVPGIDLLVAGGAVPVYASGKRVGDAVALYGGAQGWQVGMADVRMGRPGSRPRIDARTIVLGPEFGMEPAMAASVKGFEDSLNARLRARAASFGPARPGGLPAAHYLGMANCVKCHTREYTQWLTTAHAHAWETLVEQQKESTPACVPCHVTGHGRPGGYMGDDDAARLGNVQCEACHGMGTSHKAWEEDRPRVPESVCRGCHTDVTSPTFRFALYRPHVLHDPPRGLVPLPESPAHRLMHADERTHGR